MNSSSHLAAVELALSDSIRLVPGMIVESALFGILSLLFLLSTIALAQQGINVRPRFFMLTATVTMYVASAIHWGLNLYTMMREISDPDGWAVLPIGKSWLWSVVTTIALFFNFWIGDMVVMWRACVVWAWRRDVKIIFLVFLTTPVILATIDVSTAHPTSNMATFQPNAFGLAALLVSLSSNLWATSLMGYKAWTHRKKIRSYLETESRTSAAYSILAIATESGFLYCGIWGMFIVTTMINSKSPSRFTHAIAGAVPQLVGLYPMIIMLLVALRKTYCDQEISYSSRRRTDGGVESLRFAVMSHPRSTTVSVSLDVEGNRMRPTERVNEVVVELDGEEENTTHDACSNESESRMRNKSSRVSLSASLA
ncbi:hypothetical protein C8R45DRAFT_848827 [Mycena sanguinolenta]|nr:hypothetical protein C8R45DRAFT_848827 [Mycena sanguinolenta]